MWSAVIHDCACRTGLMMWKHNFRIINVILVMSDGWTWTKKHHLVHKSQASAAVWTATPEKPCVVGQSDSEEMVASWPTDSVGGTGNERTGCCGVPPSLFQKECKLHWDHFIISHQMLLNREEGWRLRCDCFTWTDSTQGKGSRGWLDGWWETHA